MAQLHGRTTECAALDRLVDEVRSGRGSTLVLLGDGGIGKTALLDRAVARSDRFRVLRAAGTPSEADLPYAALHQLCHEVDEGVTRLPGPQATQLATALGRRGSEPPDRYLVGLATLGLISELASAQPLLWVVDDAEWLDRASAQALDFVARRLGPVPVLLLIGARHPPGGEALAGLPGLVVRGLSDLAAAELLATAMPGRLDVAVRDRIVAEARGSPRALLEVAADVAPGGLAGGFEVGPVTRHVAALTEELAARTETLPAPSRRLLLLAAADPVGDPALLWRAAVRLGIRPRHVALVEAEGLVRFEARVTFRHPLLRTAVYGSASSRDRRLVHRVLARATDARAAPDRRAWHRAQATTRPDEGVARALERHAPRAKARGGHAAEGAFLARASALTPNAGRRARRALAAARAEHRAGAREAAGDLAATADAGRLDALGRAELALLRTRSEVDAGGVAGAWRSILDAARELSRLDAERGREVYLEAFEVATLHAGEDEAAPLALATAAMHAPDAPDPPRVADLLLAGVATLWASGPAASVARLRPALEALVREPDVRWSRLAGHAAAALGDDDLRHTLATCLVELARDEGDLAALPLALDAAAAAQIDAGDLPAAQLLVDEAERISAATGTVPVREAATLLEAWRGHEPRTAKNAAHRDLAPPRRGVALTTADADLVHALCRNGRDEPAAALGAAAQAVDREVGLGLGPTLELVEAETSEGCTDRSAAAVDRLTRQARACGGDWALGIGALTQALVSDGADAEAGFVDAVERLARSRRRLLHARARLLYGEWLEGQQRPAEARPHLNAALDIFTTFGARAFAIRAKARLAAYGEEADGRPGIRGRLTRQEERIAALAASGLSNPEIAARLLVSRRTVEYHLHKVFAKLGVTTRHMLPAVVPASTTTVRGADAAPKTPGATASRSPSPRRRGRPRRRTDGQSG